MSNLRNLLKTFEKKYGEDTVLNESITHEVLSTGSPSLDLATGVGGYPRGRIITFQGVESSGKTALAILGMIQCQKEGGTCAVIDLECSFDLVFAKRLGLDISEDRLIVVRPSYGEQAMDLVYDLITSNVSFILVDSTAGLITKKEMESSTEDATIAVTARLLSKSLKKFVTPLSRSKGVLVFINQLRAAVGVLYGSPVNPTGGKALKFYSSMTLSVSRKNQEKDSEGRIGGQYINVLVKKNKVGIPMRTARLCLDYNKGFDMGEELLDSAIEKGVILQVGRKFKFEEVEITFKKKFKEEFLRNEDLKNRILKRLEESL